MSRKSKIDPAEKLKIVEMVLGGKINIASASRSLDVVRSVIKAWCNLYLSEGPAGLLNQKANRVYPKEIKLQVVTEYLSGLCSLSDLVLKYHLRSTTQIRSWLKAYNNHEDLSTRTCGGGSYMNKARNTTYEERLIIVQDCLDNDMNYGLIALKYQCSYQQVRNWVKRYQKMGSAGLEDRRGHRAGTEPSRTPEEEMRDKIAELERKNRDLKMENDLLKKVRELEKKDRSL